MSGHERFEELCGLAVSGQIGAREWSELREHLEECPLCRETLTEFGKIGAEVLTEFSERVPAGVEAAMRSRFLDRARESGTPLSNYSPASPTANRWTRPLVLVPGLLAASLVLAAGGIYWRMRPQVSRATPEPSRMGVASTANVPSPATVDDQERGRLLDTVHSLEAQRKDLEGKLREAGAESADLHARLEQVDAELDAKNRELEAARAERGAATQRLADSERALANADAKLAAQEVQLTLARAEREKLIEQMNYEKANAEQARALVVAGKDGQGILAARNLHIVDVYDRDTTGKRRSFGRIFYVENQELIFYAYDLLDPRHANAEFYAWGSSLSPGQEVARLGILHNDGQNEKRWVLKYNDARVLAKLDSIFVTAETTANPAKPKGKHVLFAVLSDQPNHP